MERGDAILASIITVAIVGICLFVIPIMALTSRYDSTAQEEVKLIVEEFVTNVKNTGKITLEDFIAFENKLTATGNAYETDVQLKILDENPGKKTSQANYVKIGENVYVVKYKTQFMQELEKAPIILKEGDRIYVSAENENPTLDQNIQGSLLNFSNADEKVIFAEKEEMVTVNGAN